MKRKSLMMKTFVLAAVAMLSVSCTHPGRGWDRDRDRGDRDRSGASQSSSAQMLPDILALDLYLTADQTAKITVLRDNLIREIRPLQERMVGERERLQQQYAAGQARDNAVIESAAMNIPMLEQAVRGKRAQYLQAVVQLLTPEQNTILRSLLRGSQGASGREMGQDRDEGPGGGGMGSRGGGGMGGPGGGMGGRGGW